MKMTFKYKRACSISLVLIGVLAGIYVFLQADIEEDALVSIKARLTSTRKSVSELIQARRSSLVALATGVAHMIKSFNRLILKKAER